MSQALRPHSTYHSPVAVGQIALALLAVGVLAVRTVRTATGQALPGTSAAAHVLGAVVTGAVVAVVVAAAVFLLAGRRRAAAAALARALALDLTVVDRVAAPPRLIAALPLAFALALFLAIGRPRGLDPAAELAVDRRPALRTAASVVALLLMLPVGFQYLMSGLVVPVPDLFAMYALFGVLLAGAAVLARRRSRWVLAVPAVATGGWFLLIWLGGQYWGWQA